jgi:hypothetical protein
MCIKESPSNAPAENATIKNKTLSSVLLDNTRVINPIKEMELTTKTLTIEYVQISKVPNIHKLNFAIFKNLIDFHYQ